MKRKTTNYCIRLLAGFLLLAAGPASADSETGTWLVLVANDRIRTSGSDTRWHYWIDAQARYPDVGSGVNQLLIRPGIGYDLNESWSVWGGYARFRTHAESGATVTEDRLWEQLSWKAWRSRDAALSMRFRLEQRWLSTGDDVGHFFRYQLKYTRRLVADGDLDLVASIEPFFDLADTDYGAEAGLSQNRIYLGLHWPLTGKTSFGAGYQLQRLIREGPPDLDLHLAMVSLRTRF